MSFLTSLLKYYCSSAKARTSPCSYFISAKATYLNCSLCQVNLVIEVIVYEYQRLHNSWCYLSKGKPEFTCPWDTKSRLLSELSHKRFVLSPVEHILFLVCFRWSLFTGWFLEEYPHHGLSLSFYLNLLELTGISEVGITQFWNQDVNST